MINLKLIQDDCLKVLPTLEDESIDLILTDPPYNIGKKDIDSGKEELERVSKELFRVLKDNSFFITFGSIPKIKEVISYIEEVGFHYKWMLIVYWSNINNVLHCPIGRNVYSCILVFEKGKAKRRHFILDVFKIVIKRGEKKIGHPTPKPLNVMEKLILLGSKENDLILDPFIGSGTTMLACKNLNRNCIELKSTLIILK